MKNKITAYKIYKDIDKYFPFSEQELWDKSGIQNWKMRGKEVKKIVLCLDITKKVIEFANKNNCDLIISHHPLKIKVSSLNNKKIDMLNKSKIAAIACHTNFDNSNLGTNYYISKILGLKNPIKDKDSCMFISKYKTPIDFNEIASNIKRRLPDSKIMGFNCNNVIKKIGVIGGSGASFIDYAINKKIDLFITGDIKWHDWNDALEQNISLIDIGHIQEKVIIEGMENFLSERYSDIKTYHYHPTDDSEEIVL